MLVAGRDQRLVQRVPASLSLGHRPLAALARAQAALLPSHGETALAVFDVRNGGASAGPRCCTTRRVGALPQAAGCMCLLLSPRTACVMLTRPPEPVLKPSSVDFARRGRHPPPSGPEPPTLSSSAPRAIAHSWRHAGCHAQPAACTGCTRLSERGESSSDSLSVRPGRHMPAMARSSAARFWAF